MRSRRVVSRRKLFRRIHAAAVTEGRAHHGEILREATRLIEAGKIAPRLDARHFSLEMIEQAHAAIESGTPAGKIVVDVGA